MRDGGQLLPIIDGGYKNKRRDGARERRRGCVHATNELTLEASEGEREDRVTE